MVFSIVVLLLGVPITESVKLSGFFSCGLFRLGLTFFWVASIPLCRRSCNSLLGVVLDAVPIVLAPAAFQSLHRFCRCSTKIVMYDSLLRYANMDLV